MMEIRAKVGTKGMSVILFARAHRRPEAYGTAVGWKRNPPNIGDVIKFRSAPLQQGEKWKRGEEQVGFMGE